jgi:anti-anti-sigma factor
LYGFRRPRAEPFARPTTRHGDGGATFARFARVHPAQETGTATTADSPDLPAGICPGYEGLTMTLFAAWAASRDSLQTLWESDELYQQLRSTTHQGVLVLSVTTSHVWDEADAVRLGRELRAAVSRCAARAVVLDLQGVKVISSAACKVLTGFHELIRQRGGRLLLCGLCDQVAEVLRLTGALGGLLSRVAPLKAVRNVPAALVRLKR